MANIRDRAWEAEQDRTAFRLGSSVDPIGDRFAGETSG